MKLRNNIFAFILMALTISANCQNREKKQVYDSRITGWEILTPPAGEKPRINGPKVYGTRPEKHFIYRIPCEGKRPIKFSEEGLPSGLVLDTSNGIISGITPGTKATYNIRITATNSKGADSRSFQLIVSDRISLTPPMGWNSWGGHMLQVSDGLMRRAADILVNKGLADVGFQYVSIDDCWMRIDPDYYEKNKVMFSKRAPGFPFEEVVAPARDKYGRILANSFFPDMKGMTDYIHSYGLKAGIYSGPGPLTCQLYVSSMGYEESDAKQFSDWGFDLLKYDMCSYREIMAELQLKLPSTSPAISEITIWQPMAGYLEKQSRDILYNMCQYGRQDPWIWAPKINVHSWRIGGDLNHSVDTYFLEALRIIKNYREYSKPGQWNDPDFMYIGKIHDAKNKMEPAKDITLSPNQRYQYVSLWSMIAAPFFFSANIDELDDFAIGLLRNADITNVNQDELGHVAEIVRENETQLILVKKLADKGLVVGLYNTDPEKDQVINLKWEEIGLCCERVVRDLWRQKDLGTLNDGLSVNISPNGCALFSIY